MKFIKAQQAKAYNIYKNTKLKLLKTNAAIWYNKVCRTMGLQPNYIPIRINGQTPRDKKTKQKALIYRLNQEIKYLYQKKQLLNRNFYHQHLDATYHYKGMWQHALKEIDKQNNKYMESRYKTLNKKLDNLKKQTQ